MCSLCALYALEWRTEWWERQARRKPEGRRNERKERKNGIPACTMKEERRKERSLKEMCIWHLQGTVLGKINERL